MYGWERKSGKMRDHFAEGTTEDDVLRVLHQTRTSLLTPSLSKNNDAEVKKLQQPSSVIMLPAPSLPPDVEVATPDHSSEDVWTDAKTAGVDAYRRGDFRTAAACFASAAAMLTAEHASRVASLGSTSTSSSSDLMHHLIVDNDTKTAATLDATLDDDDVEVEEEEEEEEEDEGKESSSSPILDVTGDLAALHSNRSSAHLLSTLIVPTPSIPRDVHVHTMAQHYAAAAGEPHDALEAANACVAARPDWEKAHYRRGEARFALRLFSQAAEDFRTAMKLSSSSSSSSSSNDTVTSNDPDPFIVARLAAAEKMMLEMRGLDDEEASIRRDKEEREEKERRAQDKSTADKEIAKLTAAAEERERDPKVKRLVKQVEDLFREANEEAKEGERESGGVVGGGAGGSGASFGPPPHRLLPLLREILRFEPDFTQVSFQAAITLRRLGRVTEAVATLRRCLQSAPGFMLGYSVFGHMLESLYGREKEAEGVYLCAIGVHFDHPDAWVNLASLLVRAGRISDAIGLLRQAMMGGPEGKFRKPREDPSVLMLLGYLLHLRGHSAEPTSLYMMALGCGGGPVASYLLAKISEETGGGDDEHGAKSHHAHLAECRRNNPVATYRGFEVLNAHFATPHWDVLSANIELHRLMRDAGLEGVIAPRCFVGEERHWWLKKEKKVGQQANFARSRVGDGDDDTKQDDEGRSEDNESAGAGARLWILKGKNRVYEGVASGHPRVFRAASSAELAAAVAAATTSGEAQDNRRKKTSPSSSSSAAAAAIPADTGVMAQMYVADPLLVQDGTRKATLHFYVCVTDVKVSKEGASPAENDTACCPPEEIDDVRSDDTAASNIEAGVSVGFTLKTCPDVYSEDNDEDAAHITTRGVGGDVARCDWRDVVGAEAAEAWASEVGADWSGGVWPGVCRAAREVLTAACKHRLRNPVGEFDARRHSRLRIPKVLELVFVVDRGSRPWLVDLNVNPSINPSTNETQPRQSGGASTAAHEGILHRVIDEVWGMKETEGGEKALEPLFP